MSQHLEESSPLIYLPSIVTSKILSYLPWQEKMATVTAISPWNEALRSTEAWSFIRYGPELEENVYFAKASRDDFVTCLKQYGSFMRSLHLCFGYSIENFSIANTGKQIFILIQKKCNNLAALHVESTS